MNRHVLGLGDLFMMLFGAIVGVGWIIASSTWINQAGPLGAIIAFAGGGAVMILVGLCYAEAMATFPDSAGTVGYLYEAYGERMAFAGGWLLIISNIATCAFLMIAVPWLLEVVAPDLTLISNPLEPHLTMGQLGIVGGICVAITLGIANHVGAHTAARLQGWIVGLKIALALALASAGAYFGDARNLQPLFVGEGSGGTLGAVLSVLVTTPFWFAGFDYLPQMMREREGAFSMRRLGGLIIWTTIAAFIFYSTIILSVGSLVPRQELATFSLPTYDAFRLSIPEIPLGYAVIALGLVGVFSAWNATIFSTARVLHALGESSIAPSAFAYLHRRHATPTVAIWFVVLAGVALGLLGRDRVIHVVTAASIALICVFIMVCTAVARLRRLRPELPRAYRLPGGGAAAIVALFLCVALLGIAILEPLSGKRAMPVSWAIILCWGVLGAIVWSTSGNTRKRLTDDQRRAILLGIS